MSNLIVEENRRRTEGWNTEDYKLDKDLWPETYVCPKCSKEMRLEVSGVGKAQRMNFTCECGYSLKRKL